MSAKNFRGRRAARLAAVQALFQIEQREATASQVIVEFLERRLGQPLEDEDGIHDMIMPDTTFFSELVRGAWADKDAIDDMIRAHLSSDWELERVESVLRAILRAGVFEIKAVESTPVAVAINEYLDITRAFFGKKEVSFVNKVLDTIAKILRPTEEVAIAEVPVEEVVVDSALEESDS